MGFPRSTSGKSLVTLNDLLVGRDSELATLSGRIGDLKLGQSFALLITGEPGIGKTSLLSAVLVDLEGDVRLLQARGFEAEREIPYAGLFELVRPILDLREELPGVQRAALESAFALSKREAATSYDRLALPVALIGLFDLCVQHQPTLVVVDDVHWLDPASREAIAFVARRLPKNGLGLLLAGRSGTAELEDFSPVERHRLSGIDRRSARQVLAAATPDLPAALTAEIIANSLGNPLALQELPRALSEEELEGRRLPAQPLPVAGAIEAAFSRQLQNLPSDSRRALSLAASMGAGRVEVFERAGRGLGLSIAELAAAERAGILRIDPATSRIEFRHPLLRSTAYHAATESERRANHLALASAVDDHGRRAWHLAHAAVGHDEAVASDLESAARDARSRAAHAEAARAFARAADLSVDDAARGRRYLAAAQDLAICGQFEASLAHLDQAAPLVRDDLRLAVIRLRGHLAIRRGELASGQRILEDGGEEAFERGDHVSAAVLFLESSVSYTMTGENEAMNSVLARAARSTERIGGPGTTIRRMMSAVTASVEGETAAASQEFNHLEGALEGLDLTQLSEPVGVLAHACLWTGHVDQAARICDRLVTHLRAVSAFGALPYPLAVRALVSEASGDWVRALTEAEEADRLAEESGHAPLRSVSLAALARVEAGLGHLDAAFDHADRGLRLAEQSGATSCRLHCLAARARASLAADEPAAVVETLAEVESLQRRLGWIQPGMLMSGGDYAEALVRLGRRDEAREVVFDLQRRGERTAHPWALAVAARVELMLATGEHEVDHWAERAFAQHGRISMPFERARTELAWGERLRRLRKRQRSREPLTRALLAFEHLSATPWLRRSRDELAAAGGSLERAAGRAGDDAGFADLTPHERKVAAMVAQGMTNREAAAALFLSPKTIERHLSQIYRTLGVRSRTELSSRWATFSPESGQEVANGQDVKG